MPPTRAQIRRRRRFVAGVVLSASLLAGCGDDDDPVAAAGDPTESAGSETTTSGGDGADGEAGEPPASGGRGEGEGEDDDQVGSGDGGGDDLGGTRLSGEAASEGIGVLDVVVDDGAGTVVRYTISCQGDTAEVTGSDQVEAEAACAALATAEVQRVLLQQGTRELACTEQYGGPETATFTGTLDGHTVDVVIDRTNGCGIGWFDQVLADLIAGSP